MSEEMLVVVEYTQNGVSLIFDDERFPKDRLTFNARVEISKETAFALWLELANYLKSNNLLALKTEGV